MMKWTKPTASTIEYFERIAPGPPIQARRMFGMPSRFLNGHMLASVFGNSIMLHLSESDRAECIATGARAFAPHGRSAAEYVEIDIGHFEDQTLKEWFARGMRYLGSLPPKLGKPPRAKAAEPSAKPAKASDKGKAVKPMPAKATAKPAKAKAVKGKPVKAKAVKAKPVKVKLVKAKPAKAKAKRAATQRVARVVAPKKIAARKPAPSRRAAKKARAKKRR